MRTNINRTIPFPEQRQLTTSSRFRPATTGESAVPRQSKGVLLLNLASIRSPLKCAWPLNFTALLQTATLTNLLCRTETVTLAAYG